MLGLNTLPVVSYFVVESLIYLTRIPIKLQENIRMQKEF